MSLTAYFVRNCSGMSLRIKSISPSFKDLQLKTDETHLFGSPEEHAAYIRSASQWVQARKLEIERIDGKSAQREIEKRIVTPQSDFNDFDEDDFGRETIEVKLPQAPATEETKATTEENKETEVNASPENTESQAEVTEGSGTEGDADKVKLEGAPTEDAAQEAVDAQADLKKELADLQALLKDNTDAEAKKKINARIKEIKKIVK